MLQIRILNHYEKMFLVLLIVVAILGNIGVYLWTNDIIYFSGKDVDGIYVEEDLRIATDRNHGFSYCKLHNLNN